MKYLKLKQTDVGAAGTLVIGSNSTSDLEAVGGACVCTMVSSTAGGVQPCVLPPVSFKR